MATTPTPMPGASPSSTPKKVAPRPMMPLSYPVPAPTPGVMPSPSPSPTPNPLAQYLNPLKPSPPTTNSLLTAPAPTPTSTDPLAQYTSPLKPSPAGDPLTTLLTPFARPAKEGDAVNQQILGDINAAAAQMQGGAARSGPSPVGADPQAAYNAALAAATSAYNTQRSGIQQQGAQADTDLGAIFRDLGLSQKQGQSEVIKGAHANSSALGNIYDSLLGNINGAYGAGRSSVDSELARLGIQAAGPGALQGLVRDQQFEGTMANADRANALANNSNIENLMLNLFGATRASTGAAGASYRAQNKIATEKALNDLATQLAQQKSSLAEKKMTLDASAQNTAQSAASKTAVSNPKGLDAALSSLIGPDPTATATLQDELRSIIGQYAPNQYFQALATDGPTLQQNGVTPDQLNQLLMALAILQGKA